MTEADAVRQVLDAAGLYGYGNMIAHADEANRRRAGWRLFACLDCCDVRWIATRDRFSPSSEVCPFCNEIVLPLDEQPDEELAVDAFCNLVGTPEDRVLRSGPMSRPMTEAKAVHAVITAPLDEPIVIDAIRCRLRQDIDKFGVRHSIPTGELRLILDVVDAARHCVREWEPDATEKSRGAGTGVGMRAAEDTLIRVLKGGLRRS